jgi:16S rRNA (cytosine1402-N4)-methyltransferase
MPKQKYSTHIPVLLTQVLQFLSPGKGQSYLDVTAGYGGHAQAILEKTSNAKGTVLVDRDEEAVQALSGQFKQAGAQIIHTDFLKAAQQLADEGKKFDMILADLGVSSLHLNEASRGFSISSPGPLDMRMDTRQELTAKTITNTYSKADLAKILKEYGEEPKAHEIASRIIASRPVNTTSELAQIVAKAWPGHSKVHPATRTFQALRIAVNSELLQLEQALPLWVDLLEPGGRLVVISFHSLEDRIVKRFFADNSGTYDSELTLLTKKPVVATKDEIVFNPRARSAKLRAAAKIKTKERIG